MGIAKQSFTKELFDPLPDQAVVFVCTCIEHAIREYETSVNTMIKFEGPSCSGTRTFSSDTEAVLIYTFQSPTTAAKMRIRRTFSQQTLDRREMQLDILMHRIRTQVNMVRVSLAWNVETVFDPYAAGTDDLPVHELPENGNKSDGLFANLNHEAYNAGTGVDNARRGVEITNEVSLIKS